ncbi:hypothetical protein I553_5618 [Mycobacterium xenopi 4042]|uniref:Uncharacterized protein n=1 Tax=Mycobacterium xenopi 4042 TaxID=1299334 RepID=X7ZWF6_MYCXE|nr:hypothetical protein I553_5618 [Mycobacterium xenopi 4042]
MLVVTHGNDTPSSGLALLRNDCQNYAHLYAQKRVAQLEALNDGR